MSLRNVETQIRDLRADTGPRYHLYGWIAAVLLFGVGDLVTTFVGIELLGAVEGNPLPLAVLEGYGFAALVVLKGAAFGLFVALYYYAPPLYRTGIPLGLMEFGAVVVGWNTAVLLLVAGVL